MKTIIVGLFRSLSTIAVLTVLSVGVATAQNTLQFTKAKATPENAIQLFWASNTNEVYEIDCADSLIDTNTGTITWQTLYENYPSQGTNTFWLDTGNYFSDPVILHPSQMPMRFYRVVLTGTNTTTSTPSVSITSPTNGFGASGAIAVTVIASSDQYFLSTKLYVDGQEMNEADTSTNWTDDSGLTNYVQDTYIINSCEWPNGLHTLFATAYCQSGASGTHDVPDVAVGYGVSPFVPVNFDNLITRISFSQPFFVPEDGQTQQVTAIFAANVDWTLQIQDVNSNTVRTATGSGISMLFNWDGKDDSGTDLPIGNYAYLITAQTNGQAYQNLGNNGSSGGSSDSPPMPLFASTTTDETADATELWAMPADGSGAAVPFKLYPPGFDTNNLIIFEASPLQMEALNSSVSDSESEDAINSGTMAQFDADTPSGQSSSAPTRPPTNPVRGRAGVYGVAYQTYSANGSGFTIGPPLNGILTQHVLLEGKTTVADSTFPYPPLVEYKKESSNFVQAMRKGNWSQGFARVDDKLSINDLRGSGTIYNTVKLGLVMLHGTWGSGLDYTANGCKQMYFPITSGHSAQYLRMSEMNLGNSATNGLKWMAIAACNSLYHSDWSSMQNSGVYPYNSGLHLLLGTDSIVWTDDHIMELWAKYITKGKGTNGPMTIANAWTAGAQDAYRASGFHYGNTMKFAVAGDSYCTGDTLNNNSTPGGSWTYSSSQVWP